MAGDPSQPIISLDAAGAMPLVGLGTRGADRFTVPPSRPVRAGGRLPPSRHRHHVPQRARGRPSRPRRGTGPRRRVSNHSTSQLDELIEATGQAPQVNQIPWAPSLHDPVRLAEHLDHGVVVIPRSASRERIAANFDVFGFSLSDEELGRINGLSTGRRR